MTGRTDDVVALPDPGAGDDRDDRLAELLTVEIDVPDRLLPSRRRRPRRRMLAIVSLLALFAAGTALLAAGVSVLRRSTAGEVVEPVTDPTAPGFEAVLAPTPTLAVLSDVGGEIDAIAVLTLPDVDGGGGGVILVPTRIETDLPVFGRAVLDAAYNLGSPSVQAEAVGDLLVAAMGEFAVVDHDRWEGLVAPVAPLTIDNPDPLRVDGELRFPDATIELEAAEVGTYLSASIEGESELARLYRHQLVWEAWLDAVGADGSPDAVPGELDRGLGWFVRTLAAGPTAVETLPVIDSTSDEFGPEPTFVVDDDAVDDLVAQLIPFPRSPRDGVRPRVRLLNGTSDTALIEAVAPSLPSAGVEVVLVGNAASLTIDATTIAYADEASRPAAEQIRRVLGYGTVVADPRPSDSAEITVTLGADHE